MWKTTLYFILCKIVLLNFVNRQNYKIKLQRFGSWILLPSSGKNKGGREQKTYLLGPLFELASDLDFR
jgi:hypothetical protein